MLYTTNDCGFGMTIEHAANLKLNPLVRGPQGRHFHQMASDQFNRLAELPGHIIGITIGAVGIKLGKVGNHRVKIGEILAESSYFRLHIYCPMPGLFLQMLHHLRQREEVLLFGHRLEVSETESREVLDFLVVEYRTEALNWPGACPLFDEAAALWAAKTVYLAAQLMLYRKDEARDLPVLLPDYAGPVTPAAALSADLTLRFLPEILRHLHLIAPDDPLIPLLAAFAPRWPYSFLLQTEIQELADMQWLMDDSCLRQLFADRVIATQNHVLARHPSVQPLVLASLGLHASTLWKTFIPTHSPSEYDLH